MSYTISPEDKTAMTQGSQTSPATIETKSAPAADLNPSQSVHETNMEVALPGVTAQLYVNFVTGATLDSVVIDEGGELVKIIAGPQQITPHPDGSWKFGQQIPPGAYCIAVVKNVTQETKALKGAFIVSPANGASGPVPGSLTSPHAPAVMSAPAMPGGYGASTSPRAPAGGSPTVTPGSNEVAVLLPYGEAKRLLDIVNGAQQPLSDSERAGVARAFHHAFQRSGMG